MIGRKKPRDRFQSPEKMGGIIESLMGTLGLRNQYHGWQVVSKWPEIVGDHVAKRSEAIRYEDGILYIAVSDAAWRQELSMQTERILAEIRNLPYGRAVRQLRLVRGRKGI